MKDTCDACKFYERDTCRRYPPTAVIESSRPLWPATRHSDWCGEFQPRIQSLRQLGEG